MIRAILKKGKIEPLDALPPHWREGQELIVEGGDPPDDPAAIQAWYARLQTLARQVPEADHERMAAALDEQKRESKERMRRELGLK